MPYFIIMWSQAEIIHDVVSSGWVGVILAQTHMPTASPSLYHLTDLPTSLCWMECDALLFGIWDCHKLLIVSYQRLSRGPNSQQYLPAQGGPALPATYRSSAHSI